MIDRFARTSLVLRRPGPASRVVRRAALLVTALHALAAAPGLRAPGPLLGPAPVWTQDPPAAGGDAAATPVSRWLVAGPARAPVPAFAASPDSALLASTRLDAGPRWPAAGTATAWPGGGRLVWEERAAGVGGRLRLEAGGAATGPGPSPAGPDVAGGRVVFAVAYLDADRWQEVRLELEGSHRFDATLDGRPVANGETAVLERGKHRLQVRTARPGDGSRSGAWTLRAAVTPVTAGASVAASLDPRRTPDWMDLRDRVTFADVALSPDGGRVAVVVEEIDREEDRRVRRLQVRDAGSGATLAEVPAAEGIADPAWSRDGRRLAFTAPSAGEDGGRDLWVWTPPGGGAERVLRGVDGLGDLVWSADGAWIYHTGTVEEPVDRDLEDGVTRLTELWQRWSYWPEKAHLYAVHVVDGTRRELVADPAYSVEAPALSPAGDRIVFTRNVRRATRPYVEAEVTVLELASGELRRLLTLDEEAFGGPAGYAWSPDGRGVAFCASATEALPGPNPGTSAFEAELYATPVDEPRLAWLSQGFTPALGSGGSCGELAWSPEDGRIYVAAEDGARTVLARTAGAVDGAAPSGSMELLPAPGHVLGVHDIGARRMVGTFESPVTPPALHRLELATGESAVLAAPGLRAGDQLRLPGWEPWSFAAAGGREIEAWYWTPPGFDPAREYPVIVHYYGGTLAQKKGFDEQLVWYASRGYVVLMLNPAGAPGYGQAFSDLHVGDWGYPAGSDVIQGVRAFAAEHAFVDADRIGNFGGSYGGFLTMHLLARTDGLFAAAAERAGISNITGYWGAGWWGFSYTDGTCPGCYPWNRPDVYVDRSPIFRADEITEPLLVMHGSEDINVVPSESEQIFTALRVLGRPVEYVRFHEGGHGISSTPGMRRTFETLILEWFDRWLRDRPEAWEHRWREGEPGRKGGEEATGPAGDRPGSQGAG